MAEKNRPGHSGMTGRLSVPRLERLAGEASMPDPRMLADPQSVLALVAVAKAAQEYRRLVTPFRYPVGSAAGAALDEALAALDFADEAQP